MANNDDNIEAIHMELLVLLEEFDAICRKNNVNYSLHGGTLLGAIREHGFIPWDDDADITLLRKDFNRLVKVLKTTSLKEYLLFKRFGQTVKLIMHRANKPIVWLDIIVYDYLTSNVFLQKIKFVLMSVFRAFGRDFKSLKLTKARGKFNIIQILIIGYISLFSRFFSKDFINNMNDYFATKLAGDRKFIHRSNDQYVGMKMLLPSDVMDDYIDVEFCGLQLQIAKRYHDILVVSYGKDYIIPVKYETDIVSHKGSALALKKKYLIL